MARLSTCPKCCSTKRIGDSEKLIRCPSCKNFYCPFCSTYNINDEGEIITCDTCDRTYERSEVLQQQEYQSGKKPNRRRYYEKSSINNFETPFYLSKIDPESTRVPSSEEIPKNTDGMLKDQCTGEIEYTTDRKNDDINAFIDSLNSEQSGVNKGNFENVPIYYKNLLDSKLQNIFKQYTIEMKKFPNRGLFITKPFMRWIDQNKDLTNKAFLLKKCTEINKDHEITEYIIDKINNSKLSQNKIAESIKDFGLNISWDMVNKISTINVFNGEKDAHDKRFLRISYNIEQQIIKILNEGG